MILVQLTGLEENENIINPKISILCVVVCDDMTDTYAVHLLSYVLQKPIHKQGRRLVSASSPCEICHCHSTLRGICIKMDVISYENGSTINITREMGFSKMDPNRPVTPMIKLSNQLDTINCRK